MCLTSELLVYQACWWISVPSPGYLHARCRHHWWYCHPAVGLSLLDASIKYLRHWNNRYSCVAILSRPSSHWYFLSDTKSQNDTIRMLCAQRVPQLFLWCAVIQLNRSCALIYIYIYIRPPHHNISLVCLLFDIICDSVAALHYMYYVRITCTLCHNIHFLCITSVPCGNTYICSHSRPIAHLLYRIMCAIYYTTDDSCVHPWIVIVI
jgi:hypothetical protein